MTDTEKLELRRKVCEALGGYSVLAWDTGEGVHYRLEYPDGEWGGIRSTPERAWQDAPALESNNGLALDALKKFQDMTEWKIAQLTLNGWIRVDRAAEIELFKPSSEVQERGATIAEVICKAIITAHGKDIQDKASAESIRKAGK